MHGLTRGHRERGRVLVVHRLPDKVLAVAIPLATFPWVDGLDKEETVSPERVKARRRQGEMEFRYWTTGERERERERERRGEREHTQFTTKLDASRTTSHNNKGQQSLALFWRCLGVCGSLETFQYS
eukprot:TRINITY_DN5286_c0_g1_i11.p3 TRINITY_DN5286_c0_g1~~TRINITY_DN5286_c0_g1_i11.p3  ORF type:complete len:127 (+),score=3.70 TRINITY_DN5286_c0_g1_i11:853-1233(+)